MTGDEAASIGNLLKDGNTVDYVIFQKLLTKLGNNNTSIRNSAAINSGTPIVFQMGTVNNGTTDVPIYWQVVYQTADYITVWMTSSYTAEYFNYVGAVINSDLAGGVNGKYEPVGNYSQSTLRDVTNGIYTRLSDSSAYPVLSRIVVAPSVVATVSDWQNTQQNAYFYNSKYWSIRNGLGSNPNSGSGNANVNPGGYSWISCMGDMFWIPSHYEVFNTSISKVSYTNGFWGLSSDNYIKDNNTSTALDGKNIGNYCWLRSGYSGQARIAMRIDSSGTPGSEYVYSGSGSGVRPACHISLSALDAISKTSSITLDQQNGTGGSTSVTATNGSAMPTITPPTRTGYTFGGYFTGANGTGTQYYTNTGASARNWDKTGDATLYAKWTANTYYIAYNGNGSNGGTMSNSTHTYGTAKALTTNAYTRTGYSFLGWSTSKTATTATYTNGQSVSNLTTTNGATITLYAVWKINTYTISTSASPTGGGSISGGGTYNYNVTVTIIATPNADYFFDYWTVDGVRSGETSTRLSFAATKNTSIIAHFKLAKTYSFATTGGEVRLKGNDFQGGTSSTTATYEAIPYAGYYLIGWSVNGAVYAPSGTIYKERTLTLSKSESQGYGVFAIFSTDANVTPSPSYDLNLNTAISARMGGEARVVGCDFASLADTDTITYIAVTDKGYKFDGWYIDGVQVSTNLSTRLTKTQVYGKIIEARFSQNNASTNDDTNNTDEIL